MSDEELIQACLQDDLTAEQAEELTRKLEADPAFRARLMDATQVEGLLSAHYAPKELDVAMERRTLSALASPEQERVTEEVVLERIRGVRRQARAKARERLRPARTSPLLYALPLAAAAALVLIVWHLGYLTMPVLDRTAGVNVAEARGEVELSSGETALPLRTGMQVLTGQTVRTGADSEALLHFVDGTELTVTARTRMTLARIEGGKQVRLDEGLLKARVVPQPADAPMTLATPQASFTILGTEFALSTVNGKCRLEVTDGTIRMTMAQGGASVEVCGGEYAETRGSPGDLVHRPLPQRLNAVVGPVPGRPLDEAKVTYFVGPDGSDDNDGRTRQTPLGTLQKAADVVQPGETVLALRGIYKEGFWIHKEGREDAWITILAEPGAEIRGSDVRNDFTRESGAAPVYSIPRPDILGYWQKPDVELHNRPEQVFVNGVPLRQVNDPALLKPKNVFYVDDNARKLSVCLQGGKDPNREKTEVTMRSHAISIAGPPNMNWWPEPETGEMNRTAYVRVDGFRIRHIGNFSRHAAIQVRGLCHDILIENCDVQQVNYFGIAVGGFDRCSEKTGLWFHHHPHHVTVRNCISSRNGVQGIGGGYLEDCVFEYNLLDENNYKGVSLTFEGGAIKLLYCNNTVIRGNVARGNAHHGIWFENAGTGNVIENNLVCDSVSAGILNEATPAPPQVFPDDSREPRSKPFTAGEARVTKQTGTLIRNNIVFSTRAPGGGGLDIRNASDARVVNNIFVSNAGGGINFNGSPTREGVNGLYNNEARANICFGNGLHATVLKDEDDKRGRFFNNVFRDNLFIQAETDPPFQISGKPATADAFKAFNRGAENIIWAKNVFKDADNWDFTIVDLLLAERIGFDPRLLRLDWSALRPKAEGGEAPAPRAAE